MFDRIRHEPVVFWGLVTAAIEAVIGLGLAFDWWEWTSEQTGTVLLVVAAVGAILTFFVRSKVTPTERCRGRI